MSVGHFGSDSFATAPLCLKIIFLIASAKPFGRILRFEHVGNQIVKMALLRRFQILFHYSLEMRVGFEGRRGAAA